MSDPKLESYQVYDFDEPHGCRGCEAMVDENETYCKSCLQDIYYERD